MRTRECPGNYSSVRREGGGIRTAVQGKGEGGWGAARDGHQEKNPTRDQEFQQQPPGLNIKGRNPECRSNQDAEKNTFARDACRRVKGIKDNHGGRRLLHPSTHTQAKNHQPHRAKTHQHSERQNPGAVILVGVHQRSPPEEST